ncbi:hypothetical protein TMFG_01320, partial [Mycobacterium tuberculosis SUMu006]
SPPPPHPATPDPTHPPDPEVTNPNDSAANPNSAANPSQAAAAANIGPDPAPKNIRPELISGGNTEKFTTTAPPLTNHSQPHPRALPQTTRGHPSPRRRPPSGHHSSPGRARTGAASCP